MRLSVASTGGATGSGSAGAAACFSAAYSLTGSTTQPSEVFWAAVGKAETIRESSASAAREIGKRSRFMVILLLFFVCSVAGTRRDNAAWSPLKHHRPWGRIEI